METAPKEAAMTDNENPTVTITITVYPGIAERSTCNSAPYADIIVDAVIRKMQRDPSTRRTTS
jgi:hypothetical protein